MSRTNCKLSPYVCLYTNRNTSHTRNHSNGIRGSSVIIDCSTGITRFVNESGERVEFTTPWKDNVLSFDISGPDTSESSTSETESEEYESDEEYGNE